MRELAQLVNLLFDIYFWVIIVRIFLTWIPSIDWYKQPFAAIAAMSDVVLEPFRKIIPPIGGIDISPILALFILSLVQGLVVKLLLLMQ